MASSRYTKDCQTVTLDVKGSIYIRVILTEIFYSELLSVMKKNGNNKTTYGTEEKLSVFNIVNICISS